jgi:hypothetical protein
MLVGVGVKLAIYKPLASPYSHVAFPQRLELCAPLALVFFVQLFHTIVVKTWHHYSCSTLLSQPMHALVVGSRVLLLASLPLVSLVPLQPAYLLLVLAGMSIVQCVLLLAHDFRFGIKSNKAHPMRELPNALLALQQKRKRAASVAEGLASQPGGGENRRLLPKKKPGPKTHSPQTHAPQSV